GTDLVAQASRGAIAAGPALGVDHFDPLSGAADAGLMAPQRRSAASPSGASRRSAAGIRAAIRGASADVIQGRVMPPRQRRGNGMKAARVLKALAIYRAFAGLSVWLAPSQMARAFGLKVGED